MKKTCLALLALTALAACSSPPPAATPSAEHHVRFLCDNGQTLSVHFSDATAVLTRNGSDITLQQQPSGSGFIYSNGPNTIRGKGDDLTVEIGRMVPLQCRVQY